VFICHQLSRHTYIKSITLLTVKLGLLNEVQKFEVLFINLN